ncbi:WASH complex subunit 2A-like isoform X2 [Pseudophryne corroboree]|uniref:WASH complex subunit 2A-like isoform X2 n=1 Tax=Pseudophryne corroboree TaxID=495146 RepID=UPI0030813628
MNGHVSSAAEEPVWERPWSLEEIRRSSQSWSLGADAGLLHFLKEFSHQTISRTHDIEKQLDGLVRETKTTECRLHNIFNDFLMLSNTQFIENRVYDEEVEEHIVKSDPGEKPEQEKTREQKEAELIPKIQEAVNYGLQVLETAFEQLDIKAGNSDSEEEEVNERVELILEPKDLYIDRPLPYLIGSQLFMQQEDVGLGDISSEEGSVDNDRGSVIDSQEEDEKDNDEDSEEDFGNNSDEEKKLHTALSDEDEDNGSDLFGDSDKEEEEENEKSTKTRTKSFADELAARIQVEVPKRQEVDQSSILSSEVKSKKEKKEIRKLPSDDEDDYIFKPPKLTDEDFFGNKGGLFSGGKGLFDDDDEEGDLFSDVHSKERKQTEAAPVPKPETLPSDVKKKPPYGGVSLFHEDVINSSVLADKEKRKLPTPTDAAPNPPNNTGLFDDDEIFGGSATAQAAGKAKEAADLFADEDLFNDHNSSTFKNSKESEAPKPTTLDKKVAQLPTEKPKLPEPSTKKQIRGLFSDEEDSETDLFLPSQSVGKSKTTMLPTTKASNALSLFDDEDEDLFGAVPEKQPLPTSVKSVQQPAAAKSLKSGLFSSDEEDPITVSNNRKPVEKSKKDAAIPPNAKKEERTEKKSSLFNNGDDDLFAITKESQKKHHRVSLLFEEDEIGEEPLFAAEVTPSPSVGQALNPSSTSVPAKVENEKVSLFDDRDEKPESKAPVHTSQDKRPSVPKKENTVKPAPLQEPVDDIFAASPLTSKHTKIKSKNVLSLFGDEENNMEDHFPAKITPKDSGEDSLEKNTHGKSTGVFQDEELLFSQELQEDNDPDVDLFASTSKKSSEKPSNTKPSAGVGLFGDDADDDLFSTAKPKKPPKVQEKKPVIKRESLETSKESDRLPGANEKPTDPSPIKTKSPSSRIGKLQANLLINPAALLPGAVPKLAGARSIAPEIDSPAPSVAESTRSSDAVGKSAEAASFDTTAQVDTLYSANKSRVKVGSKRRPPTRLGRKLASQDSGETEGLNESSPISPTPDTNSKSGFGESSRQLDRHEKTSTMKLSLSENDVQSRANTKVAINPLTPDINDLFGSDLFAKTSLPNPVVSRQQIEESHGNEFTKKSIVNQGKKSPAVAIDDGSDDDPFKSIKVKKALQPTSLISNEPEDDLFGIKKPQRKVDSLPVPPKDIKPTTSDIFEDDIFAAEAIKPVKKTKEKKAASETNLFDDNMDIFADLKHKPKEKKSKKKVEPKSIFDDDMDDIFSTSASNIKKTKPKTKSSQPASDTKPDAKVSTAFDDPLNVFGK